RRDRERLRDPPSAPLPRGRLVMRVGLVALAGLLAVACGASPRERARRPDPVRAASRAREALGVARYVVTEMRGVSWDEGGAASPGPRVEPALLDGVRLSLDRGMVVAERHGPEALMGFRSMPSRLGGGFVVWSADRTYRADSWLGDLRPIVDTGADGGVRPGL